MATVEITGWLPGFRKVSCTKLLQSQVGIGLADAKSITDGILNGVPQLIQLPIGIEADDLATALQGLGAVAHVRSRL